jgi:hypothetical protein
MTLDSQLDLAAHFARGILDLALCRRECILDRDHDVLVFGRIAVSLADEDILMLRHRDANAVGVGFPDSLECYRIHVSDETFACSMLLSRERYESTLALSRTFDLFWPICAELS